MKLDRASSDLVPFPARLRVRFPGALDAVDRPVHPLDLDRTGSVADRPGRRGLLFAA